MPSLLVLPFPPLVLDIHLKHKAQEAAQSSLRHLAHCTKEWSSCRSSLFIHHFLLTGHHLTPLNRMQRLPSLESLMQSLLDPPPKENESVD